MSDSAGGNIETKKQLTRCPVFRIDLKGRFVNVDDLTEKFLGQPSDYYFGKNISEFLDEPSNLSMQEILASGRHFETFFKSVNLTFINTNNEQIQAGAIVSLNFIGGNPSNFQFILTSTFSEPIGEPEGADDGTPLTERLMQWLGRISGDADWNDLTKCLCQDKNIRFASLYLYDEGVLVQLSENYNLNIEGTTAPVDIDNRHIDVAAKKEPIIPDPAASGSTFEFCRPLVCREHCWGVLRIISGVNSGDITETYKITSNIIGNALYSHVSHRWYEKKEKNNLNELIHKFIVAYDCTFMALHRNGNISKEFSRFVSGDQALASVDNVFQLFHPESGLRQEKALIEDKSLFKSESSELSVNRELLVEFNNSRRYLKVVDLDSKSFAGAEYGLMLFRGTLVDQINSEDRDLIGAVTTSAEQFINTISKDAVMLSAKSYRQLAREGREHLNNIQNHCRQYLESHKRIMRLLEFLNKDLKFEQVELSKILEKAAQTVSLPDRQNPLYELRDSLLLNTDRELMAEVMASILSNIAATNPSPDSPPVAITANRLERGNVLVFSIPGFGQGNSPNFAYHLPQAANDAGPKKYNPEYFIVGRVLKAIKAKVDIQASAAGSSITLNFSD